jgi:hypothetical protein
MVDRVIRIVAVTKSFNPEPEATAVLSRDCRAETAGAFGFGLNEEDTSVD